MTTIVDPCINGWFGFLRILMMCITYTHVSECFFPPALQRPAVDWVSCGERWEWCFEPCCPALKRLREILRGRSKSLRPLCSAWQLLLRIWMQNAEILSTFANKHQLNAALMRLKWVWKSARSCCLLCYLNRQRALSKRCCTRSLSCALSLAFVVAH